MNLSNSVAIATKVIFKSAIQEGKEIFRQVKTGLAGKLSSAKQSQHELKSNNYNQKTLRTNIAIHNIMSAAEKEFNSDNKKLYDYTSQLSKTDTTEKPSKTAATDQKAGEVNTNTTASYGRVWDTNLILLGDAQITDQLAGRKTWDFSRKKVLAELKPMVVPTVPTSDKPHAAPTTTTVVNTQKPGDVNTKEASNTATPRNYYWTEDKLESLDKAQLRQLMTPETNKSVTESSKKKTLGSLLTQKKTLDKPVPMDVPRVDKPQVAPTTADEINTQPPTRPTMKANTASMNGNYPAEKTHVKSDMRPDLQAELQAAFKKFGLVN